MNAYIKKFKQASFRIIMLFACCSFTSTLLAGDEAKTNDINSYEVLAKHMLVELKNVRSENIDNIMAMHVKLMNLGSNVFREYMLVKHEDLKLMNLVINSRKEMQGMSLQEIKKQWHKDTYLNSTGIGNSKVSRASIMNGLVGSVVHPATAYIALNQYKKTHDQKYLTEARGELQKSLDQLAVLKSY